MNWKTCLSIVGGIAVICGTELGKITSWQEALTPQFVGLLILQFGGLALALGGALYTSKPGGMDATQDMLKKLGPTLLLVLCLLPALTGCGQKQVVTVANVSDQVSQAAVTAQTAVSDAYAAKSIGKPAHDQTQALFERMGIVILTVNQAIRAGQAATAAGQLRAYADAVQYAIDHDLVSLSPGERIVLTAILTSFRTSLLAYIQTIGGGD